MNEVTSRFSSLKVQPGQLMPILTAATISSLVVITYQISFGSLIFGGELTPYLSSGIGFCLMGVVVLNILESLLSSNPGMIAIPTAGSAAILATVATALAAGLRTEPERMFPTVTAAITGATLLTGATFLVLGRFQLGNLIRYFPHPVIGGFLAGTGWLVVSGALKTMSGVAFTAGNIRRYFSDELLLRWLPGVIFGLILLLIIRRFKHYLVLPGMLLGAIAIFYVYLWLNGISIAQAAELGLLFQPFPAGALWRPPPVTDLAIVDWLAIFGEAGEVVTLILISSITLLLYATGVEVSTGKEINLNQELRSCGVGNLAGAFSASPPGYIIITMSVLSHKLGASHRLVGLLVAGISAIVMFFGAPLIALFPKPVLGGVLTYLGATFLVDWLLVGFRKLARADYLIVVVIMLTMSIFGLLTGLAAGLMLAAVLFIVQYSRVPVIRHSYTGRSYQSRVERSTPHMELLQREGSALQILELQGYLFFGTANRVYQYIKAALSMVRGTPPKMVMLDFTRVSGLDVSAALSFVRLKRLLSSHHVLLAFTGMRAEIEAQLRADVLTATGKEQWKVFSDVDHGVEWYEEQVLESDVGRQAVVRAQAGAVQLGQERGGLALLFAALLAEAEAEELPGEEGLLMLMNYLEEVPITAGEVLIRQGEPQPFIYLLESGEWNVEIQSGDDQNLRLETGGPGTITGEVSFILGIPSPATVTVATTGVSYRLTGPMLRRLELESPMTAAILHRFLLKRVSRRLVRMLETVEVMI